MDQLRHLFFLLQWATIILTKSTTAQQHQTKLTILYLTDSTLTANKARLFESFLDKISNTTSLRRKVELRSQVLPKDSRTLLPILRVLNSSIAWTGIGIVVLDLQGDNLRTISLFSCLGLLFDIRTRPAEEDKTFTRTITVKPSITQLHKAVDRIFGEIGWISMAEIECHSRNDPGIEKMKQALNAIKESKFRFMFVKCLDSIDLVLKYATTIGLTSSDYRWVFPGIRNLKDINAYLPRNVIGIDLPGTPIRYGSTGEENILFLKDVLSVLEMTLTENSEKLSMENEWTSKRFTTLLRRYIVNRTFPGHTGDVIFDQEGRRSGEAYEIFELITFKGEQQWLPIGSLERGNVNIQFNQWRLDNNRKFSEVPELRVVTVYKPPWIKFAAEHPRSTSTDACSIGRRCRRYTNVTYSTLSDMEYEDHCCTGFVIDFLERLETDAGFRGVVHLAKDGKFGSNDPKTQRWNGMIGELVRDEADMALSSLTITAKRSKVVDFTYPFTDAAMGILVSTEPASHSIWEFVFLDTFSGSLWIALFVAVQVVIVVLWLAERLRQRRRFINNPYNRDNSISCTDIINYTWSLVFQKASEEVGPTTLGGRTVAALFAFCTIIACSSFTANLAAIKVSERDGISITGIHDSKFQNSNGDFTFGTLADSSNIDFFRDSEDSAFQRIYQQLKNNVVSTEAEGAMKVANRQWSAFINDIPQLTYLVSNQTQCRLQIVGDPFFFAGYGIALQKNSSWNTRLSLIMTRLLRDGFIHSLHSKWLSSTCGDSANPSTEKMGVNDIGGAFLVVGFGCIASGILLGLEYLVWRTVAAGARPINEDTQRRNLNQTLSSFTKVFTLWDVNNSTKSPPYAEATLRNFRTLTQRRHPGD